MLTIYEKSTAQIPLTFLDSHGELLIPTTLEYVILDEESGVHLSYEKIQNPGVSEYILKIEAEQNTFVDSDKTNEVRILSVLITYGFGLQIINEYRYNLSKSYIPTSDNTKLTAKIIKFDDTTNQFFDDNSYVIWG